MRCWVWLRRILELPVANLSVSNGLSGAGGTDVAKAHAGRTPGRPHLLHGAITATNPQINGASGGLAPGALGTKPVANYTIVGTKVPRIDIPAKVSGRSRMSTTSAFPGMLHGRAVRPRGTGRLPARHLAAVVSVDAKSISHIPGVQLLRQGNFIGVVAPFEYDAIQAAAELKVTWANDDTLPGQREPLRVDQRTPPATSTIRAPHRCQHRQCRHCSAIGFEGALGQLRIIRSTSMA